MAEVNRARMRALMHQMMVERNDPAGGELAMAIADVIADAIEENNDWLTARLRVTFEPPQQPS